MECTAPDLEQVTRVEQSDPCVEHGLALVRSGSIALWMCEDGCMYGPDLQGNGLVWLNCEDFRSDETDGSGTT